MKQLLIYFRKRLGFTQKAFSEKLHVSRPTLSKYEDDLSNITMKTFYDITKILKLKEKEVAQLFNSIYNEMEEK